MVFGGGTCVVILWYMCHVCGIGLPYVVCVCLCTCVMCGVCVL